MSIDKAIEDYMKNHCELLESPKCSKCSTKEGPIYEDDLSGENFCRPCLVKDLKEDEEALQDYMSPDE